MMADGTDLAHRLRFASPQVRAALGLPPLHLEDGKGTSPAMPPVMCWDRTNSARRRGAPAMRCAGGRSRTISGG